jgi:ribosomal subunit interface protein
MIKNMEIDTEDYDLSDDLRKRIQDKIAGLDEFMDTLDRAHVTVSWEGGQDEQTRVRAQVSGKGHKFEASDTDWKAVTAIDKTHSKLESQIRRVHDKEISKRNHNRR